MKNFLFIAVLSASVIVPLTSYASFDRNLSYGMSGSDIYDLQDLLSEAGCLNVASTGYFGPKTLSAVKCWQKANSVPSTGYFGILSRTAANDILATMIQTSQQAEIDETGTTTPVVTTPAPIHTPVTSNPTPVVGAQTELNIGLSTPTCTSNSDVAGPGVKAYEYTVETDWNTVGSVLVRNSLSGYNGGRIISKNNRLTTPVVIEDSRFGGPVTLRLYAYASFSDADSQNNLIKMSEVTVSKPVCN